MIEASTNRVKKAVKVLRPSGRTLNLIKPQAQKRDAVNETKNCFMWFFPCDDIRHNMLIEAMAVKLRIAIPTNSIKKPL